MRLLIPGHKRHDPPLRKRLQERHWLELEGHCIHNSRFVKERAPKPELLGPMFRGAHSLLTRLCCKATVCQPPPFLTKTRVNMTSCFVSLPSIVPARSALPVITAVLPYTRTFISATSLLVSLVRPDLKFSIICDLSDIFPLKLMKV